VCSTKRCHAPKVEHRPDEDAAERREDGGAAEVEGPVLEEQLLTRCDRVSAQLSKGSTRAFDVGSLQLLRIARAWQMTSPSRLRAPAVTALTATGLLRAPAESETVASERHSARRPLRQSTKGLACLTTPCTPPRSRLRRHRRRRRRRRLHRRCPHAAARCCHHRRRESAAPRLWRRAGSGAARSVRRRVSA
jgi:hypothetical protein